MSLGCAHGPKKFVQAPPGGATVSTVFVYPFAFRWVEPAYRSFELSQRLIGTAIATGGERFAFYGPNEFKVLRASDDAAWVASTALPLLLEAAQRPEQGVILRAWAEKRTGTTTKEAFDQKGRAKGVAATEETTFLGHVEVIHPSSKTVLINVEGEARVDPFADPVPEDEFDPTRPLTVLMSKLTAAAIESLREFSVERTVSKDPQLTLALTPKVTLGYLEEGRDSGELEASRLNAVDRELFEQTRAKFLAPWLPDTELDKVIRHPPGVYVGAVSPGSPLAPGDLILTIDGELALPQKLARQRFKGVPAQLRVRKSSGQETDVLLQ